jgi:hypothetical protein
MMIAAALAITANRNISRGWLCAASARIPGSGHERAFSDAVNALFERPDGKGLIVMKCANCHQPKIVLGENMLSGHHETRAFFHLQQNLQQNAGEGYWRMVADSD